MYVRPSTESIVVRSKSSPSGNTVATIPGAFAEVKFDTHGSIFLMFYSACENPRCSCADVVVTFSEKRFQKKPEHRLTEFGAELNIKTWRVGRLYGASTVTRPLMDEFVTGLNAERKEDILVKYSSFRQAVENASRFAAPAAKIRKGHMVAADEVFGVNKEASSCGLTRPLLEEHQGILYRLLDFYCMNPSCKCGETHLRVIRTVKDTASDKPWMTVRLHFDGKVGLSDVTGALTRHQATSLVAEWIRKDPALLGDIEARYERIKDVGRRILSRKST